MANQDSGYFGMKIGEALSSGAGYISDALRRKYEIQRRMEEEAREQKMAQERQNQLMSLTMAKEGVAYDPMNPAASFEQYAQTASKTRDLQTRGMEADIAFKEARAKQVGEGGMGGGFGVEKLKIGGREVEVPVRYSPTGPIPINLPSQAQAKPLNQFQTNAAAGVMAARKLESMIDAADGKAIGRFGGMAAALPQKSITGKLLRMGDPTAQEFAATRDEIVDLLARIRTGAVITSNEEKIYANKIYSILQDEGVNKKNIQMIRDYFQRALPKGYNPETASYESPEMEQGNPDFTPDEIELYERMIAEGK